MQSTHDPDNDSSILAEEKSFHHHPVSSDHVPQVRLTTERGPSGRAAIHWLRALSAWMAIWVLSVASNFSDAPLRSGNRPKATALKSDESTEVEGTSAEEDQDWNNDSDADWTVDSEGRSSLSGRNVCALVTSDGQASLWRSISETDLLVSEEEVNQTFECWMEDSVGITGLCGPELDELLLANVR